MIVEHHAPEFRQNMEASLLITTVIVSMDTGTSEAIYLVTALRFLGSIAGVALGLLIQTFEISLLSQRQTQLPFGGVIVLRLLTLAPPIFACVYYMKKYSRYLTVFLLIAINCPAVVLSQRSQAPLTIVLGTVFGSLTAVLTWIIFDRSSSETYLKESCIQTTTDILSLLQMGLARPNVDLTFTNHLKERIQTNILTGKQAYKQYSIWRSWLCSKTTHDFDPIYDRLRDLFFRASLLAIKEESDDSLQYFYGLIDAPIKSIISSIDETKTKIVWIFDEDIEFEHRMEIVEELIQGEFQDGIIMNFDGLTDAVELFGVEDQRYRQYIIEVKLSLHAFGKLLEAMIQTILDVPEREKQTTIIRDSLRYLFRDQMKPRDPSAEINTGE